MASSAPVGQEKPAVDRVLYNHVFQSMKRAHDMFSHDRDNFVEGDEKA
jgi:hypothetical protein